MPCSIPVDGVNSTNEAPAFRGFMYAPVSLYFTVGRASTASTWTMTLVGVPFHPIWTRPLVFYHDAGACCIEPPRYFYQFTSVQPVEPIFVKWDSEIGAAGDVVVALWGERIETGEFSNIGLLNFVSLPIRLTNGLLVLSVDNRLEILTLILECRG